MQSISHLIKSRITLYFFALITISINTITSASAAVQPGDIFVSVANGIDGNKGGVLYVDPATNIHTIISSGGSFVDPMDITFSQDGSLYVADFSAAVIKVDPDTGAQTVIASGAPLSKPAGITVDNDGTLLVADNISRIIRIDPVTGVQTVVSIGGLLDRPNGIAVDASGNIFVADMAYETVSLFAAGGAVIKIDPVTGDQSIVSEHNNFVNPFGLTIDNTGNLYVADFGDFLSNDLDGLIIKVDQSTGGQSIISSADFRSPSNIALENDGSILVADRNYLSCNTNFGGVTRLDPATASQTALTPCGNFVDVSGVTVVPGPNTIDVSIDIKPGSNPNCFNINGNGVIPVAILGSNILNTSLIKTDDTLSFNGLSVRVRGKKGPLCNYGNSNGDAYLDLICHFEDDTSQWIEGNNTTATLLGELTDGTLIEGTDSICVTP